MDKSATNRLGQRKPRGGKRSEVGRDRAGPRPGAKRREASDAADFERRDVGRISLWLNFGLR
jgi:hypothetical protein